MSTIQLLDISICYSINYQIDEMILQRNQIEICKSTKIKCRIKMEDVESNITLELNEKVFLISLDPI